MKARSEPTTHNRKRPQSGTVDTEDAEDTEDTEGTRTQQQHCGRVGCGCRLSARLLSAVGSRCTPPQRHTATQRTRVVGWDLSLTGVRC